MALQYICRNCEVAFTPKYKVMKSKIPKYCCQSCASKATFNLKRERLIEGGKHRFYPRKRYDIVCFTCGKTFKVHNYKKDKAKFCSKKCEYGVYVKKVPNTYRSAYRDGKNTNYHRVLMENYLGRRLAKGEVVHHIDENPRNNEISNLKVMDGKEHTSFHGKKNLKEAMIKFRRVNGITTT